MRRSTIERRPDPDMKPSAGPGKNSSRTKRPEPDHLESPQPKEARTDENNNPSGEYRRVTNNDEQDKITNAGNTNSPFDEKEQEGV